MNCYMCRASYQGGFIDRDVPAMYRCREYATGITYNLCQRHVDKICREPALGEVIGEVEVEA